MSTNDIIRAWRDEEFRKSLSDEQRATLPPHPAGLLELSDEELDSVAGAKVIIARTSWIDECQRLTGIFDYLATLFGGR